MSGSKLTIYIEASTPDGVQTYESSKSEFTLGRSSKADVRIEDSGISREHLKIKFENSSLFVLDLSSLNGVYIDGQKIQAMEWVAFHEKSKLSFSKCPVTLKVRAVSEDAKTVVYPSATGQQKPTEPQAIDLLAHSSTPDNKNESEQVDPIAVAIKGFSESPKESIPASKATEIEEDSKKVVLAEILKPTETAKASEPEKKESPEKPAPTLKKSEEHAIDQSNVKKDDKKKPREMTDEEIIASRPEDQAEFDKLINISRFPKTEDDFKISFKNVGLDLPKYKNPGQHAKEIIQEAEYQKRAIIKSAEVFRSRTINETRIQSKKAAEEAEVEFKKHIDQLLDNTRLELKRLRTETEMMLDEKRIQANEEIQRLWTEHEEQVRIDKEKQFQTFEQENKIKLDLSIEKARSDMFAERHKIITEAENEVLQKKRAYQVEFENEKTEHLLKIRAYNEELNKIQSAIEENKKISKDSKTQREDSELELSKVLSSLKAEKENLQIVNNSFKETLESHKKIENELASFHETKANALAEVDRIQNELQKLNYSYQTITEKKMLADQELEKINEVLKDAKAKAKAEVETEYANLKQIEAKKFEDFRANELKELQKIRDAHSASIKNFSVDLSQEIATKLELLASKSGYAKFDFEKHFELINSVIQVKGAVNTGSESKHAEQLENWKNRKRKENFSLMARGFAAGIVILVLGNFAYKKLNIDPVQAELARIAAENKAKDVENQFVPTKTDQYYDNYLESTLYTRRFAEVYLDNTNQREWVNYATKYFLRQWKVDEEKVIEVISNSNALVQNVLSEMPKLKKTRLKADLARLKEIEDQYIENQARILGSNVRYDAYKKIEKEFFTSKLQGRVPASQD